MKNTLRGFGIQRVTLTNVPRLEPGNYKLRASIVALISVVTTLSFILFLVEEYSPVPYTPLFTWSWPILVSAHVILAYSFFVAIQDWIQGQRKTSVSKLSQGYDA